MTESEVRELEPKDWCSVAWKVLLVMVLLHLAGAGCLYYFSLAHTGWDGLFAGLFASGFLCSVAGNIALIILLPFLRFFITEIFESSTLQKSITFSFIFSLILFFWYLMIEIVIIVCVDGWSFVPLFSLGAIIFQFLPFTVIYTCLMVRKAKKLKYK